MDTPQKRILPACFRSSNARAHSPGGVSRVLVATAAPHRAADRPGAEADLGDGKAALAEGALPHARRCITRSAPCAMRSFAVQVSIEVGFAHHAAVRAAPASGG